VGKLLLEAGSPVEWETGAEPAEGILEIVAAWQRAWLTTTRPAPAGAGRAGLRIESSRT